MFVLYFKYLFEVFVRYFIDEDKCVGYLRKKKKAKFEKFESIKDEVNDDLLFEKWYLRVLVVLFLYKCFFYDIGNYKFFDFLKF